MRLNVIFLLNLLLIFSLTAPTLALSQAAGGQKKEDESTPMPKGFKTVILEVKHRDPQMLASALRGLSSGLGNAQVSANPALKIITVRDYPENVAAIEAALKRLDVPEAPEPPVANLEVQLHLIAASRSSSEKSALPAGLEPVINQLQATLKYGGYRYVTTLLNRVKSGGNVESTGVTDAIFPQLTSNLGKTFYNFSLNSVRLISDTTGGEIIQIPRFKFGAKVPVVVGSANPPSIQYNDIGIYTELSLREGDLVVVGTTNISSADEAVIVVVSVKKVK